MSDFVPESFPVPAGLSAAGLRLEPLGPAHLQLDHAAVQASHERLRGLFGPDSAWPPADLTAEADLQDLRAHAADFEARRAFAYTVLSPDASACLGCVYIYPPSRSGCDAEVYFWASECLVAEGGEPRLEAVLRVWLATAWPFRQVAWPGRDIDWPSWLARGPSARRLAGAPNPPGL